MSDDNFLPVYREENGDWVVRPKYVMTYLNEMVQQHGHRMALAHAYMTAAQLMAATAKSLLNGELQVHVEGPEVLETAEPIDHDAPKAN